MNGWNEFDHYLQSISVPNWHRQCIFNWINHPLWNWKWHWESRQSEKQWNPHPLEMSTVMILHNIDIINIDPSHFVPIKCRCICSWIVGSKSKHGYWIRPNLKAFNHLYCIIQPSKICCYCKDSKIWFSRFWENKTLPVLFSLVKFDFAGG